MEFCRYLWHYQNSLFRWEREFEQLIYFLTPSQTTMPIQVSKRVENIKPSVTLAISNRATELKAQGQDIIDLSIGEPDFDTPEFIKQAAIEALHAGFTKYTAVDGILGLKQAIVNKLAQENHLHYQVNQIIVSSGAKQSLANLFTALLNAEDEVIIPAPYWVSYPEMILLSDAKSVIIPTTIEQRFKITPQQLEAAITPKTKLLILNSPSNPSGMVYSRQELSALGEVLLRHPQILIASDDIYEHILWTAEPFANIVNACPELYDRTVVVNGVSKAYAMTGWRIGYAAGPAPLIAAMKKVQSQTTSNPNSIAQKAAQAALTGNQDFIKNMTVEFQRRHDFIITQLNNISGLKCIPGDGAFYVFVSIKKLLESCGLKTDVEFADYLLQEAKVAVVPGSGFGAEGFIRISYATDLHTLEQACLRIHAAVTKLQESTVNERRLQSKVD
jgi:aspartate aminotransferase